MNDVNEMIDALKEVSKGRQAQIYENGHYLDIDREDLENLLPQIRVKPRPRLWTVALLSDGSIVSAGKGIPYGCKKGTHFMDAITVEEKL